MQTKEEALEAQEANFEEVKVLTYSQEGATISMKPVTKHTCVQKDKDQSRDERRGEKRVQHVQEEDEGSLNSPRACEPKV